MVQESHFKVILPKEGPTLIPKKVLIIDDEGIREGLIAILSDEGYHVDWAEDGKAALDILKSKPLPSLILLDIMMLIMDEISFSKEKQNIPEFKMVPKIVLTAGVIADRVKTLPAVTWIRKPLDLELLLEQIREQTLILIELFNTYYKISCESFF